jgi:regulatory protein
MEFARNPGRPRTFLNGAALYDYAVKALGRRMRTQTELRRLMKSRVEPGEPGEEAINSVFARLREHGYIDDAAFAETYARLRQENDKLGRRRVRQSLGQKGVPPEIIDQAVEASYAQTNEEALALQHLERKRIRKPENEKETARLIRRLALAGFSTGVIYRILRQWDVPEQFLSSLESLDSDDREGDSE